VNNRLKIAVYDEMQANREVTVRLLTAYYKAKSQTVEILQFKDAEELTGSFRKNSFSAVFIGINGMRDVDAAWVIRDRDKKCPLIITSKNGDYSLEGYRLEATDYLTEPLDEQKVYRALEQIKKKRNGGIQ